MQKAAVRSAPRVAANRSLLRPQPLLQRSRTLGAVNVSAAAPAQAVKITIQGRRLPVSLCGTAGASEACTDTS
jgi:hypothetical protein